MDNVLVNGRLEIIGSDRDIIDIIRESCGNDFANYIEERFCFDLTDLNQLYLRLSDKECEKLEADVLNQTDYHNYESTLDEWNCAGNDIVEECDKQINYIETAKRVDKNKLWESFKEIKRILNNML